MFKVKSLPGMLKPHGVDSGLPAGSQGSEGLTFARVHVHRKALPSPLTWRAAFSFHDLFYCPLPLKHVGEATVM